MLKKSHNLISQKGRKMVKNLEKVEKGEKSLKNGEECWKSQIYRNSKNGE